MKVFIGPYPKSRPLNRILKVFLPWEQVHKIQDFLRKCGLIERERAIRIKVHGYDVWSMDATIAMLARPLLEEYKRQVNGVPGSFIQDRGYTYQLTDEEHEVIFKEWLEVVDKMILGMERILEDGPLDNSEWEKYHSEMQEGLELFGKYLTSLWT